MKVKKVVPDVDVLENRFLGHYGTVLDFCLFSKKVEF